MKAIDGAGNLGIKKGIYLFPEIVKTLYNKS